MKLSKIEMETVLNWNMAEKVAYLYTHDKPLIRKLEQWRKERPDECKLERMSHEGKSADYILPRSWIHVYPPRKSTTMTEERREQLREQLERAKHG